jgi:F-type H+-transporting ATPase subunit b
MLTNPTFWVGVSFAIFIWLALKMGAAKAITGALDGRAKQISDDLAEAARLRTDAEKLLAEYEGKRKEAETEAANIIAQAKADAERMAAETEAKLNDFIKRRTAAAETKIAQAESQATAEVRAAAADAAVAAAEQVLRKNLAGKGGDTLLAASLRDVKGRLN